MQQSPAETTPRFDVLIVGSGPAGLTAAIAVAMTGARTALVGRRIPYADNRTTALLGGTVAFLEGLDVWDRCKAASAPLERMRLIDDTGRLFRSPEVTFNCEEMGLQAFGHNIHNRALSEALNSRADELASLTRYDADADSVETEAAQVIVTLSDGSRLAASLVIGADGRHSMCREAARIAIVTEDLPQAAMTFNVTHTRPHNNISTEFHTRNGPCVFVPLPGNRSSVVWVSEPGATARRMSLDDDSLSLEVEKQAHSILGKMKVEAERHRFPLQIGRPQQIAANRIALVGESAHVLPPIGAQGLNMGLRDAEAIADIVRDVASTGGDVGNDLVMSRYARARSGDIRLRSLAIAMANRSLLNEHLPVQALRMVGTQLLKNVSPLKRLAMRQGLGS